MRLLKPDIIRDQEKVLVICALLTLHTQTGLRYTKFYAVGTQCDRVQVYARLIQPVEGDSDPSIALGSLTQDSTASRDLDVSALIGAVQRRGEAGRIIKSV